MGCVPSVFQTADDHNAPGIIADSMPPILQKLQESHCNGAPSQSDRTEAVLSFIDLKTTRTKKVQNTFNAQK
jgi:hypothetical protein